MSFDAYSMAQKRTPGGVRCASSLNCPSEGAVGVHNHIVELLAVGTVGLPLPGAVGEARDLDLLAAVRTTNAEDIGVVAVLVVDTDVITEQGAALSAD